MAASPARITGMQKAWGWRGPWRSSYPNPAQAGSPRTICPGSCPDGPAVMDTTHPGELDVRVWLLDMSGSWLAVQLLHLMVQHRLRPLHNVRYPPQKGLLFSLLLSNLDGQHKLPMLSLVTSPQANIFDSLRVQSQLAVVTWVTITLTVLHRCKIVKFVWAALFPFCTYLNHQRQGRSSPEVLGSLFLVCFPRK